MNELPQPLLQHAPREQAPADHLSWSTFWRCRVLVAFAVAEAGASVVVAIGAYHWDVEELWRDDVSQCTGMHSIIDIALAAVVRALLFMVLVAHSPRFLRRASSLIVSVCLLCFIWSLVKLVALKHSPNGVVCASNVDGPVTVPRDETLSLAVVALSLFANLLEVASLVVLKKMIRRDEQMSAVLRDVEAHTSSVAYLRNVLPAGNEDEPDPPNVRHLVDRAKPEAVWLFAGCAVLMVRLPFSLSLPHFVSETISALILKDVALARINISYFCIAGVVDAALDFWCVFLFGYTQQRLVRSLRIDLFRSLLTQDIAFFDKAASGDISSRLTSDCAEMANDLTWVFRFSIEAIVRIGGIGGYMFYRCWRLALVACSVIPVVAVINRFYGAWCSHICIYVHTSKYIYVL